MLPRMALPEGANPDDQHEPELIAGAGPTLMQLWRLESDGTRYEITVVFGEPRDPGGGAWWRSTARATATACGPT